MAQKKDSPDYQALSLALDEVLAKLQQPEVQVDEAVALYQEGLRLVNQLEAHLQQAENTITRLKLEAANEGQA
jgi:exodeoxyribonuclease VII small subunit